MVTKDGAKMSKSYGNVVSQETISEQLGIDTARLFLMFVSSPESELEWSDEGVQGSYRFLTKVFNLVENYVTTTDDGASAGSKSIGSESIGSKDPFIESKRNACIRDVTAHLEAFRLNKMVLSIMEFANEVLKCANDISRAQMARSIETLALLLSPLTPHIAEEVWQMLGNDGFITLAEWPVYDESKIDAKIEDNAAFVEETISGLRKTLQQKNISPNRIELFQAESWKYDFVTAFKETFATVKNPKEIADILVKKVSYNEEEVTKLTFSVYKNQKLLPLVDRTLEEETVLLEEIVGKLREEFDCEVVLTVDVFSSADPKAKNGLPGKPAISLQ
jgi:leucyl-tRNA synthetase